MTDHYQGRRDDRPADTEVDRGSPTYHGLDVLREVVIT